MFGTYHNWEKDLMDKIKIAFIKFGGMAIGGTEKVLQTIAAELPKDEFIIILSTNIDISCLIFLFNSGALSISYILLSIFIRIMFRIIILNII